MAIITNKSVSKLAVPLGIILFLLLLKGFLMLHFVLPLEIHQIKFASLLYLRPGLFLLINLLIGFSSSFLFSLFFVKTTKISKEITSWQFIVAFILFFFNPWLTNLLTFHPIANLSLFIFISGIYFKKPIIFLAIAVIIFLKLPNFENNKSLFINQLSFKNIATEINERQKIDFLAVNKKFILPGIIRKLTYNKIFYPLNKSFNHLIAYFDFEEHFSPLSSYEILKLSGIPPKGNLNNFLLWELPLIIIGIFYLLKYEPKLFKKGLILFFLTLIPYFIFEKKFLSSTAFLSLPLVLFSELFGINKIVSALSNKYKGNGKIVNLLLLFVFLIIFCFEFSFYETFYTKYENYQSPHSYLYQKTANWIKDNIQNNQKIVITDRFGSTNITIPYYLNNKYPNLEFKKIDKDTNISEPNTIYIGLIGEFVGRGKELEKKPVPSSVNTIAKISSEDETVFEYGKELWIVKSK